METLILKSLKEGTGGVIEYGQANNCVKVKYNIRVNREGIYKLLMLSSLKPVNEPVIADTPELNHLCAYGEKEIGIGELAFKGYNPNDCDTFVLVCREGDIFTPAAAGFCRLAWNFGVNGFFDPEFGRDESLIRAQNSLNSLKHPCCAEKLYEISERLAKLKGMLKKSASAPLPDFEWYEISEKNLPLDTSAYRHLTDNIPHGVPLLFGIGDGALTALAMSTKEKYGFENARDCITEKNGFYIVGVLFGEDGQYFARLE